MKAMYTRDSDIPNIEINEVSQCDSFESLKYRIIPTIMQNIAATTPPNIHIAINEAMFMQI